MALEQYTQDLNEYLDRTKNQILRDLLAKGHRLSDVGSPVEQVNDEVRTQFAGSSVSNQQLGKDVADAFITLVIAQGFRLSAKLVSNTLAVKGRLNNKQAICLWLGLFYDQSISCEGLWQMYVDYRSLAEGPAFAFPKFISDECGDLDAADENLLQDRLLDYWEGHLEMANQALSAAGKAPIQPKDIPNFIAWIVATRLDQQSPQGAAEDLGRALIGVHNDLRRGYHTLLSQHLEDIYHHIDLT